MSICINSINPRIVFTLVVICLCTGACDSNKPEGKLAGRTAMISPDYSNSVIPANIAPLNFIVRETGVSYYVDIFCKDDGEHIILNQAGNKILIPANQWRRLLQQNRGGTLYITISVKAASGEWINFAPIKNRIAAEDIDSHVAYRLINPAYVLWWNMGIYQRCLENFEESAIFSNKLTKMNCVNCHSFCKNNPDIMMFHMRSSYGGTILIKDGVIRKINTATSYTMSAGVYPAWHPNGTHIAFSINKITQRFHAQKDKSIYVNDQASDLILYDIEKNMVTTSPKVSTSGLENVPHWSPDGRYLYFCCGPKYSDTDWYQQVKYDLKRIACDVQANQWGEVETILSAEKTDKSISFPRVSPDGKYLLFSMSDYGYFSIHFASSDLYLMDLENRTYTYLPVNSAYSDSYHSWSSNSRWFIFASKRMDGVFSRLFISYLDQEGNASKPFLLPQKDPTFYDRYVMNYNVPELITGPVKTSIFELARVAYEDALSVDFDPDVDIDALSGATRITR
jgi:hypothetical protein